MLTLLLALMTSAAPATRIAVPNFSAVGVKADSLPFFLDRFANRLRERSVVVTTPSEVEAVLGLDRQKQLLGCEQDSTCMAEIAAALGVDFIVRVRVARFDKSFEVTMTLIDAHTAAVVGARTTSAPDETRLLTVLDEAADRFATQARAVLAPSESTSAPLRGPLPIWLALLPGVAGAGMGIGGGILISNSFGRVQQIATALDPVAVAASARLERGVGIGLAAAGAVAIGVSVALLLDKGTGAASASVYATPEAAGVVVGGAFP